MVYNGSTAFEQNTLNYTFTGTGSDSIKLLASVTGGSGGGLLVDNFKLSESATQLINEDTSLTLTEAELLANITDADANDTLSVSNVRVDSGSASIVDNGDGTWTLIPDAHWSGEGQISFDISDGAATITNQMSFSVAGVADTPVINLSDSEQISLMDFENQGLATGWSSANTPEINQASVYGVTDSSGGDSYIMDLDDDDLGDSATTLDQLSYTVDTSSGFDHEITFDVRARPESLSGAETDEMDVIWNGEVIQTINPTGSWESVTIRLPANGSDSGTLELKEKAGQNNDYGPLLDNLAINKINTISSPEDTNIEFSLPVSLDDSDGSEALTLSLSGVPSGFTLGDGNNSAVSTGAAIDVSGWNMNQLTLTPVADSISDFTMTLTATTTESLGGDTAVSTQDIHIDLIPVDDAPVASNVDLGQTNEDTSFVITEAMLLANATDVDGDSLSIVSVSVDNNVHGAVIDNGDSTWTFTPAAHFNGNDIAFTFTVSDGTSGDEVSASALIDVTAVNDAADLTADTDSGNASAESSMITGSASVSGE